MAPEAEVLLTAKTCCSGIGSLSKSTFRATVRKHFEILRPIFIVHVFLMLVVDVNVTFEF